MKNIFLLIPLTFCLVPIAFSGDSEDLIRIMTYNIRYAGDETKEGINSWNNRKEKVASIITSYKGDIIGFQEALKIQLDDLKTLLPEYDWIGAGRDDGKNGGEFSAILFRKDRFEVIEYSTFWLSETPGIPSKGWDAAFNRIVTLAKFMDKETEKTFFHFNTHFDHVGEMARLESGNLLNDKIAEIAGDAPTVITGDFNFKPDSKGYKILTGGMKNYLIDTQPSEEMLKNPEENITFNGFGEFLEEGNKIDYIFIKNNVEVIKHQIIMDTFEGRFPSDHMPVLAEVRIK
jgi:endonuclease/exonuclease/phosphatase family metal-dependent hydrolase